MNAKLPKIDPAVVYVCIQGHASKAGTFASGARVRASDPAVTTAPTHWLPDGSTDAEVSAAIVDRFGPSGLAGRPR